MSDPRTTHRPLWLLMQDFLQTLTTLFGAPEDVAARGTLVHRDWAQMATWVRAGEALLRQLLLIAAAVLPKPNLRPILWVKRARKRRLVHFYPDAPQDWRVSFRCFVDRARKPRSKGVAPKPRKPRATREDRWSYERFKAARFHSAWPLAERMEALIRVFNDPAPYARRLARRLYARPERAAPMLKVAPTLTPLVGEESFATTRTAGLAALRAFDTS
jgi:hypothetical protein